MMGLLLSIGTRETQSRKNSKLEVTYVNNLFQQKKIGIIGFGHLGSVFANCLLLNGLPKRNLMIGKRQSLQTSARIKAAGLAECVQDNSFLFAKSDILFLTIRPQDLLELDGCSPSSKTMILSFLAGVPLDILQAMFGNQVWRVVCSNPETFLAQKAIAGVFPSNETVLGTMELLHAKLVVIPTEHDTSVFVSSTCFAGALLLVRDDVDRESAISKLEQQSPIFRTLYEWAKQVVPPLSNEHEIAAYLNMMMTKRGITEAVINCLRNGYTLDEAILAGVERCNEISSQLKSDYTLKKHN